MNKYLEKISGFYSGTTVSAAKPVSIKKPSAAKAMASGAEVKKKLTSPHLM